MVKHNGQVEGEQWEGRKIRRLQPKESDMSWEETQDSLLFVVKSKQGSGQSGDWKTTLENWTSPEGRGSDA